VTYYRDPEDKVTEEIQCTECGGVVKVSYLPNEWDSWQCRYIK